MQGKRTQSGKGREAVDKALAHVLALFESGELPEAVARTTIARLESDSPVSSWSLGNRLLVLMAGTEDARGFNQWKQAGRHVVKGAHAFYILAPSTRKVTDTDAVTGEEVSRTAVVGFVGVPVFSFESTEGEPIVRPDYRPVQLPPLLDVAERLGVSVKWLPASGAGYGYYTRTREEIVLCSGDEPVFFHELGHAAHQRVLERSGRALKGGQHVGQSRSSESRRPPAVPPNLPRHCTSPERGYTPIDPAAGRGKRVQPRVRRPTRLRSIIEECRTARTAMHASPNARRARLLAAKRRVWVKRGLVDRRTRCKPAAHLLPVGDTSRERVMLRGLDASRRSRLPRYYACNFRR